MCDIVSKSGTKIKAQIVNERKCLGEAKFGKIGELCYVYRDVTVDNLTIYRSKVFSFEVSRDVLEKRRERVKTQVRGKQAYMLPVVLLPFCTFI